MFFFSKAAVQVIKGIGTCEIGGERIESVGAAAKTEKKKSAEKAKGATNPLIRHKVAKLFRGVCASDDVAFAATPRRPRIRNSTMFVVCGISQEDAADDNEEVGN